MTGKRRKTTESAEKHQKICRKTLQYMVIAVYIIDDDILCVIYFKKMFAI